MAERRVPRWLVWAGIPVVAIGLVVAFWNWDWFVPMVERRASAVLGRPVHIAHLHVSLGRITTVSADRVRIDNPDGFEAPAPFAEAERLTAQVDVMAYWQRNEIILPLVEVQRPVLQVIAREDGGNNYSFDPVQPAGEGDAPAESRPMAAPQIRVLRIADGNARVVIPNLRADFNLKVATRDESGPEPRVAVEAIGTYAGQRITGTALGGALLALQETGRPWPVEMQLANGPTRATLRGTLSNPLQLAGADVRLELRGPDMALLQPLTGVTIPKTPNYVVTGQLDYAEGRVRFRDFQGRVGQSDLTGTVTVTRQDKPDVVAELYSSRVDLADLGGLLGEEPPRRPAPVQTARQRQEQARNQARTRVVPDEPFNLPRLDAANLRLSYRADSVVGRNTPFDGLRAEMDVRDGVVTLRPLALRVGRGQIEGNIQLTPQDNDQLHAVADAQFQRLDVSRLMQATQASDGPGILGGRARLDGTGASFAAILANGTGGLTLTTMGNGTLSTLLADLAGPRLGNAVVSALGIPGRTAVGCFLGDFALERGTLTSRVLVLETAEVLMLGAGAIDLGRERIGLRLRSHAKDPAATAQPSSLLVDGTFRNPNVAPELDETLARGGAAGGLAALVAPLTALLPSIQLGIGEDDRCERMLRGGGTAAPARRAAPSAQRSRQEAQGGR
ncbi:AsmA family protein [Muricoccus radiodurans]|uniref:AsmA family protein n=1 Tax=Muricoccus radiodurans TaxID=2231721 RepID=UPI003CE8248A